MKINDNLNSFNITKPEKIANPFKTEETQESKGIVSFGQLFNNVIQGVNNKLLQAGEMSRKVASGEVKDINQVVFCMARSWIITKDDKRYSSKINRRS